MLKRQTSSLIFKRCKFSFGHKIYVNKNQHLQITFYCNETDRHSFSHYKSENLLSTKESIPFNQALRQKRPN